MTSIEQLETEVNEFAKGNITTITPVLLEVLEGIKRNGIQAYDWNNLKKVIATQMTQSMDEKSFANPYISQRDETLNDRREKIIEMLITFEAAPFTLQRLIEVIMEPQRTYRNINKLLNGLEKLLSVSTTLPQQDFNAANTLSTEGSYNVISESTASSGDMKSVESSLEGPIETKAAWATTKED